MRYGQPALVSSGTALVSPSSVISSDVSADAATSAAVYGWAAAPSTSIAGPGLDDLAAVHDDDVVAQVAHEAQVVADEQVRDAEALLELEEQVDDLRADRHVERRQRLVEDDDLGVLGDGSGDGDALALAARQLVRVALGHPRAEADQLEQLLGPRRAGPSWSPARSIACCSVIACQIRSRGSSELYGFWNTAATAWRYLRRSSPDRPRQRPALEHHVARRRRLEHEQLAGQRRLAAPGLADDAERAAAPDDARRRRRGRGRCRRRGAWYVLVSSRASSTRSRVRDGRSSSRGRSRRHRHVGLDAAHLHLAERLDRAGSPSCSASSASGQRGANGHPAGRSVSGGG